MKKKIIEKIPYLTLPKLSQEKCVKYIGITTLVKVVGEKMLMLEVYKNSKDCQKVPQVRIVLGSKDFGTYFPGKEEWKQWRITKNEWSSYGLIWWSRNKDEGVTVREMISENILESEADLERIQKFTEKHAYVYDRKEWWEYIDQHQKYLSQKMYEEKKGRRDKRRAEALKDRAENTSELPEKRILEYADDNIFHNKHLLIYKKHGNRATIACTKCGGVTDARWKQGQSYMSQFERHIEEPVQGRGGTCPICGARGIFSAQGKITSKREEKSYVFLGEKYKENGFILRYIEVGKEWKLELMAGEKGLEMYAACEELWGIEIAREYYELGKKVQRDYHKHDPYSGRDFWDDCNLYGMENVAVREGRVMRETYENMKGTFLQYSALKEYQEAAGKLKMNPMDYMEQYIQMPQIEMLVKMNLIGVVNKLVGGMHIIVGNKNANRPDDFLGIYKNRVRQLIERKGDANILSVMQMEKRMKASWTEEQMENLAETDIQENQLSEALKFMSIQKLLNRIKKYANCEYGTQCSHATGRLRQVAGIYLDYLTMRKALGYDLNNTVYQQPRDLAAAHAKMTAESNKSEQDKRCAKAEVLFPMIKKNYRSLRKKYYFEDETYCIRPARSATEIVVEGRTLHHCVGGDNYLGRHNRKDSIILFLRYKDQPGIPYITVEVDDKKLSIRQWYGERNKKPDKGEMQKWLDKYITRLKSGNLAAGDQPQEILLAAAI